MLEQKGIYDFVKGNLQVRICDPELNPERLFKMVHRMEGDYAAFYYLNISDSNGEPTEVPVTNELFATWGVSKEQLHADALAADKNREPLFCLATDIMSELIFGIEPHNMFKEETSIIPGIMELPMYCLTNAEKEHAASLLFHDDILEKIGSIIRTDYYVLPSSIHELMILPAYTPMGIADMKDMVQEINTFEIPSYFRLSDKIQYYSREEKTLENAERRETRLIAEKKQRLEKSIKERMEAAKKEVSEKTTATPERKTKKVEAVM